MRNNLKPCNVNSLANGRVACRLSADEHALLGSSQESLVSLGAIYISDESGRIMTVTKWTLVRQLRSGIFSFFFSVWIVRLLAMAL